MSLQDRKALKFCQVCATEGHQGEERGKPGTHKHGQARSIVVKRDSLVRVQMISHMEINA
jgi:hypothetical protein